MTQPAPVNLVEEKWDYLIILDACRYDYFEQLWKMNFSKGNLECRLSIGSCTDEWRDNTFGGFYENIVYITANPQISSSSRVFGYLASEHFRYIHEIWRENWDDKYGTVRPEVMSQRALEIIGQCPPGMRYIIHYLQPHAPYLSVFCETGPKSLTEFNQFLLDPDHEESPLTIRRRIFNFLRPLCKNKYLFSSHPEWILRKLLQLSPKGPMEIAWRKLGTKGLKDAYKNNLKIVLENVQKLIGRLPGTIVITSDHGEFLGEERQFAHPRGSKHPILKNVPWLVIENAASVSRAEHRYSKTAESPPPPHKETSTEAENAQEVIKRLRALGYYE